MPAQLSDVWFITGCSTGFGRELAKLVLDRGYRAVITARELRSIEDLTAGREGRALALKLDVTNKVEVAEAVKTAQSTFGGIDVLVNNAGYGYVGAVEESEEDEVRAMVDTNFFGLARMIRAVLPAMRKRRHGSIVNISSNGGLLAFPGFGYYNATKFAVEGLSEALATEVAPLGIRVLLVEPGPFRTDWAGRSLRRSAERIAEYAETAGVALERLTSGSGKQVGDPVRAGKAILKAVESEQMPLHLVLGKIAVETARSKIELLRRDVDAWEETALGADYPEHQTTVVK
jgi:NAD(P)-dependent dehydrogenase (short-subunit alcohol dehydrogenase family)